MAGIIKGTVINQRDTQPLSGATLTLTGSSDQTTSSDGNGNFAFNNLAEGNYDLTVTKSGFEDSIYGPLMVLDGLTLDLTLALDYDMR